MVKAIVFVVLLVIAVAVLAKILSIILSFLGFVWTLTRVAAQLAIIGGIVYLAWNFVIKRGRLIG